MLLMVLMLLMLLMVLLPCSTAGAELAGSMVVVRLGGSGGLREEEEEVLESWPGSGDTSECRSAEIPEEVDPEELYLAWSGEGWTWSGSSTVPGSWPAGCRVLVLSSSSPSSESVSPSSPSLTPPSCSRSQS